MSNVLFGNKGDDTLRAGSNGDTLFGGQDGDSLVGGVGNDQLQGNLGNDSLFSSSGADSVFGGQGNDYIAQGTSTAIASQTGADTVWAGQGNDTIDYTGTDANVVLFGNIGSDAITGGNGADTIYGGQGGDTVVGNEGADVIYGDLGNDSLSGGSGVDSIVGGAGNDTLSGGVGSDFLTGGDGNDQFNLLDNSLIASGIVDTIYDYGTGDSIAFNSVGLAAMGTSGGTTGWWTNVATSGMSSYMRSYSTLAEAVNGAGSATSFGLVSGGLVYIQSQGALYTVGQNASITTGGVMTNMTQVANVTGSPTLSAANFTIGDLNGTSTTTTTTGVTTTGTSASESIPGTTGNDVLFGGAGNDTFTVTGNDVITDFSIGNDALIVNAGGTATLNGVLDLSTSSVFNSGTIVLTGVDGTVDTMVGSAGADSFSSGTGNDSVTGNGGNDTITVGAGIDTVVSGTGNDSIVFTETAAGTADTANYAIAGTSNVDTITGFEAGTDIVQFSMTNTDFGGIALASSQGTDVTAAGETVAAVTVNTSAAVADGANLLFFNNSSSTSFATAIGTAVITDTTGTNWTNNTAIAAVYYDATNSQAVFGYITDTNSAGTAITSADTFTEVVRVGMTVANYTMVNIGASFAFV